MQQTQEFTELQDGWEVPTETMPVKQYDAAVSLLNVPSLMPMARQYVRDVHTAVETAKAIVTVDAETAGECFYSLPRGGKQITGPSIGLAETLASCWGNLVVSIDDAEIGDTHVTLRGWVVDTQSGLATQDFIRRRITDKHGNKYNDDMINTTTLAARSILYRNLVLRVIPRPIQKSVFAAARNVALGEGKTFTERQKAVIKRFKDDFNVSEQKLLAHLDHTSAKQISINDIDYLLGIYNAIKEGQTTADEVFKKAEVSALKQSLDSIADELEEETKQNG